VPQPSPSRAQPRSPPFFLIVLLIVVVSSSFWSPPQFLRRRAPALAPVLSHAPTHSRAPAHARAPTWRGQGRAFGSCSCARPHRDVVPLPRLKVPSPGKLFTPGSACARSLLSPFSRSRARPPGFSPATTATVAPSASLSFPSLSTALARARPPFRTPVRPNACTHVHARIVHGCRHAGVGHPSLIVTALESPLRRALAIQAPPFLLSAGSPRSSSCLLCRFDVQPPEHLVTGELTSVRRSFAA
jgi:hypothetical protein